MLQPRASVELSRTSGRLAAVLAHAGPELSSAHRQELLSCAHERLRTLAHRQLRRYPAVARWEQTDDVLQGAMLRLDRALQQVQVRDVRHFLALASTMIRRELIDLQRKLFGAEGVGRNHGTRNPHQPAAEEQLPGAAVDDPARRAEWEEFHEHVERLPPDLREVTDLIWYQELSMEDTAALLGVSSKTISRRWREARLALAQVIGPV